MSKKASPLCDCGASEETAVHYFLNCKVYNEFIPEKIDKLNLLCKDDCDEMEKFIYMSQAAACDGTRITTTAEGQEVAAGTLPMY